MSVDDKYEIKRTIGSGSYGKVFMAINKETEEIVAIKDIEYNFTNIDTEAYVDDGSPLNEVIALNILSEGGGHPNVLKLIEFFQTKNNVFLVLEYLPVDVKTYIDRMEINNSSMSPQLLKSYSYQFLKGLKFCHDLGIIHRDLKPANILIDKLGHLKIADFGLAWNTRVSPACNSDSYTFWYRPPEILFGIGCYDLSADIWAAGCTIYEMATNRPLFVADSVIQLVFAHFSEFGTPTEETWPEMRNLPYYNKSYPVVKEGSMLSKMQVNLEIRDLLLFMLKMNPNQRPTVDECLNHPYILE